jgi:uncharacterized membrane protein
LTTAAARRVAASSFIVNDYQQEMMVRRFRAAAGVGLFLLTLAVSPANVYMLEHAEQFAVPYALLVLRLPLQVGLLALIAWSSDAAGLFRRP